MARGSAPFFGLTMDLTELAETSGFIREYTNELSTNAFKRELTGAIHQEMASGFDLWMSTWALTHKANYTHVYETALHGDPYRLVGKSAHKLWIHEKRYVDGGYMASFRFRPAVNRIPTYKQRRNSTVGEDPLRHIPESDFTTLLEKSKQRRWVFRWKAHMEEYNIPRMVSPRYAQMIFLPVSGVSSRKGGGEGWRFVDSYMVRQDPPGDSAGAFTAAWTMYWSKTMTPQKFDNIVGNQLAKTIEAATSSGLATRSRRKTIKFMAETDFESALIAGKAKGKKAAKTTIERLSMMNSDTKWRMIAGAK